MGQDINMDIHVESAIGFAQPTDITTEPDQTVQDLVRQVADIQGVDPDSISLVKDGKLLDRKLSLKKAGLRDGDQLKAIPKDPIGGAHTDLSPLTRSRIQNEIRRARDARIPLQILDPLTYRTRIMGSGRWQRQEFHVLIQLHPTHPARPPRIRFLDQPDPPHPNIGPDGHVCLSHFQQDWSPIHNFVTIHEDLIWLLKNPNYDHPLHPRYRVGQRPSPPSAMRRLMAAWR